MKKSILVAVVLICLFVACRKSEGTVVNYLPSTTGSSWTYDETIISRINNQETNQNFQNTSTMTGRDTLINGRTYKVIANTVDANSYRGKIQEDYFLYGRFAPIFGNNIELNYLKENLAAGASWNTIFLANVPGQGDLNVRIRYTIGVKDSAMTVRGNNFKNVIRVKLDVFVISQIGEISIGNGNYYYANGVGEIKSQISINALGQSYNMSQDLLRYSIK